MGSLAVLFVFPVMLLAHRLDEYLQAARLSIAPDRVVLKMDLTPGVDVAPMIFWLINANHDGRISESEEREYANQILNDVVLEIDGQHEQFELVRSQFPSFEEMRAGIGAIRIEAQAVWRSSPGRHWLFYQNNHKPDLGAYLVNPLVPASREIEITQQRRDPAQRELRLDFEVRSSTATPDSSPTLVAIVLSLSALIGYGCNHYAAHARKRVPG